MLIVNTVYPLTFKKPSLQQYVHGLVTRIRKKHSSCHHKVHSYHQTISKPIKVANSSNSATPNLSSQYFSIKTRKRTQQQNLCFSACFPFPIILSFFNHSCSICTSLEIEQVMATPQQENNALFGKYELGKLLGCGAFAKVYHARDLINGQSVAIKIINKSKISHNATLMCNIKREISIMRRLNHPNVVKLFEVLASKSKIYLVMEFVKGGELFERIANKGRLSEELCRKMFQQLISAVSYCHARGVYHRDLKPENMLIDENGDLKVSDFGLSAFSDQIRKDGLLHTLCGTPAYVAPEILAKKGYDGAKIDVWSCGVILFVLSAGYLPFNDPNLMVMYEKIYRGEFRCPKMMSSELKRFMSRIFDVNPLTRITIDEIKHDPWFKKGFKDVKFYDEVIGDSNKVAKQDENLGFSFNAFDLISLSSGLDLSGLFDERCNSGEESERLVVEDSAERIIEKIGEKVKEEGNGHVMLRRMKKWGVELQGKNGKFRISLEIYQLSNNLVVVEAKRLGGEAVHFDELWKNKIKLCIVNQ